MSMCIKDHGYFKGICDDNTEEMSQGKLPNEHDYFLHFVFYRMSCFHSLCYVVPPATAPISVLSPPPPSPGPQRGLGEDGWQVHRDPQRELWCPPVGPSVWGPRFIIVPADGTPSTSGRASRNNAMRLRNVCVRNVCVL